MSRCCSLHRRDATPGRLNSGVHRPVDSGGWARRALRHRGVLHVVKDEPACIPTSTLPMTSSAGILSGWLATPRATSACSPLPAADTCRTEPGMKYALGSGTLGERRRSEGCSLSNKQVQYPLLNFATATTISADSQRDL